MKYLLVAIALSTLLVIGIFYTLSEEISDLKARDRLQDEEIRALRGLIGVTDAKCDHIIEEIRDMTEPYERVIPISNGFLLMRGEEE